MGLRAQALGLCTGTEAGSLPASGRGRALATASVAASWLRQAPPSHGHAHGGGPGWPRAATSRASSRAHPRPAPAVVGRHVARLVAASPPGGQPEPQPQACHHGHVGQSAGCGSPAVVAGRPRPRRHALRAGSRGRGPAPVLLLWLRRGRPSPGPRQLGGRATPLPVPGGGVRPRGRGRPRAAVPAAPARPQWRGPAGHRQRPRHWWPCPPGAAGGSSGCGHHSTGGRAGHPVL